MLDLKKMLENLPEYKEKLKNKKFDLDEKYFLDITADISKNKKEMQDLQTKLNKGSAQIGALVQQKADKAEIEKAKAEMGELAEKVKEKEDYVRGK